MTSPLRARLAALVVTACALLAGLVAGPGTASAEPALAATTATTNTPVTVTFTFDDGLDQHVLAAQILESHGMRGVFFVNPVGFDTPGYLSTTQVVAMQSAGHEIGDIPSATPICLRSTTPRSVARCAMTAWPSWPRGLPSPPSPIHTETPTPRSPPW